MPNRPIRTRPSSRMDNNIVHYILIDDVVVGGVQRFGNNRFGITDRDGKSIGDESFRTLGDLCAAYERVTTWLSFGDIARNRLAQQCQYASRMIDGRHGSPNLGEGLRFQDRTGDAVDIADYHSIHIHRDDIEEFVKRVTDWRVANDGNY